MTISSNATVAGFKENSVFGEKRKQRLLGSCALTASLLASVCGPAQAQMQATLSSGTATGGIPSVSNAGATTTVTVSGADSRTILNWLPNSIPVDGENIDVLNADSTLNFVGTENYTVLNRFVNSVGGSLANQIELNGTVNSYVGSVGGAQGGNIWFYNAGGILVGNTGVFNVGSLMLTTNDIPNFADLTQGAEIRFRGASGSTSAITMNGVVNAGRSGNPGGSYVAMVAPRVVHRGRVDVDGSTAYVAAEQVDMRINNGLFDINVLVGAEGGLAIDHSGTTTGSAQQPNGVNENRIYMVAVPKNDAITMLVGGHIGYQNALTPQVEPNGAIRLSAGYNITNGEVDSSPVNDVDADIVLQDSIFSDQLHAMASGNLLVAPVGTLSSDTAQAEQGLFDTRNGAVLFGNRSARIELREGQEIHSLSATDGSNRALTLFSNVSARAEVGGGRWEAANSVWIAADHIHDGDVEAGVARFVQTGGEVLINGGLIVSADAYSVGSGSAIAGQAGVDISDGALSSTDIEVSAFGASIRGSDPMSADAGGNGFGGEASFVVGGGSVQTGAVRVVASGLGSMGASAAQANATGQPAGDGGTGTGGAVSLSVLSGSLEADRINVTADGAGGAGGNYSGGQVVAGGNGGAGLGGTVSLILAHDLSSTPVTNISAIAVGGEGGDGSSGGRGGRAEGGTASLIIDNVAVGELYQTIDVSALGGAGGASSQLGGADGGAAIAGTARIDAFGANTELSVAGANLLTEARGGSGSAGADGVGGRGGRGTGGVQEIIARDGARVSLSGSSPGQNAYFDSEGIGGDAGHGGYAGDGVGGALHLRALGGTISSASQLFQAYYSGISGSANGGYSGFQRGGSVVLETTRTADGVGRLEFNEARFNTRGGARGNVEIIGNGIITANTLNIESVGGPYEYDDYTEGLENGIHVAIGDGGHIDVPDALDFWSSGDVSIRIDGDARFEVGGSASIYTDRDIHIRHTDRAAGADTIFSGGDISLFATGEINSAENTQITSGDKLTVNSLWGDIRVDHIRALGDIDVLTYSSAFVEHVEAGGSLFVKGAAVNLRASSVRGAIIAEGERVSFDTIDADGDVSLVAYGVLPDAEGIRGNVISADGNVRLSADGDVVVGTSVSARGGWTDPNNLSGAVSEGNVFVSAGGNVALSEVNASRMVGVYAGETASVTGARAGEDIFLVTHGEAVLSDFIAGDDVDVIAASIVANNLQATGAGSDGAVINLGENHVLEINSSTNDGSNINLRAISGTVTAQGLDASSDLNISSMGALLAEGGLRAGRVMDLSAAGLAVENVSAGMGAALTATEGGVSATGTVSSGGDIIIVAARSIDATRIEAGSDIRIASLGDVDLGGTQSQGDVHVSGQSIRFDQLETNGSTRIETVGASAGEASIQGTRLSARGDVSLNGHDGVAVNTLRSAGATRLTSQQGSISVSELSAAEAVDVRARSVDINGSGNLAFTSLIASDGDARVHAVGSLLVEAASATGRIELQAGETLNVSALQSGLAQLNAADDIAINDINVDATLDVHSSGIVTVDGLIRGGEISLVSNDIAINEAGRIESNGRIRLVSGNDQFGTYVGGSENVIGYHLDAEEIGRIYGAEVSIFGPAISASGGQSDLIIDDFTMSAGHPGSNLGASGSLTLETAGTMWVVGDVNINDATDQNALHMKAGRALQVLVGQGRIQLSDAEGPNGMLTMMAPEVIVATVEAIADLSQYTRLQEIEARLSQNDKAAVDRSAIVSGGIEVSFDDAFYVQNTGEGTTFDERRGVTFGSAGLKLNAATSSRLVFNGAYLPAYNLEYVTGLEIPSLLAQNGDIGQFESGSSVNGCEIATIQACGRSDTFSLLPMQDLMNGPLRADEDYLGALSPLIVLRGSNLWEGATN